MFQRRLVAWHVVSAPCAAVTVTHCGHLDESDPEFLLHAGLPSPLAKQLLYPDERHGFMEATWSWAGAKCLVKALLL